MLVSGWRGKGLNRPEQRALRVTPARLPLLKAQAIAPASGSSTGFRACTLNAAGHIIPPTSSE